MCFHIDFTVAPLAVSLAVSISFLSFFLAPCTLIYMQNRIPNARSCVVYYVKTFWIRKTMECNLRNSIYLFIINSKLKMCSGGFQHITTWKCQEATMCKIHTHPIIIMNEWMSTTINLNFHFVVFWFICKMVFGYLTAWDSRLLYLSFLLSIYLSLFTFSFTLFSPPQWWVTFVSGLCHFNHPKNIHVRSFCCVAWYSVI